MSNLNQIAAIRIRSNISLEDAPYSIKEKCILANTFPNPAYESNELAGRSNWDTEPRITTYSHKSEGLILPRGYGQDLYKLLQESDIAFEIVDERITIPCEYPQALSGINLRPYQERAVNSAMQRSQGVIVSPTGSGKSFIGLELIRQRRQKALIIVHRGELAKQWIDIINERMGIKAGFIGDSQWDIGNEITVAMVQTLAAKENETKATSNAFGLVLLDEVHHAPASTFFDVLGLFPAKFRYGLSATVQRRDGLEKMIYHAVGPVVSTIQKSEVEGIGATVPAVVEVVETGFKPQFCDSWAEYQTAIATSERRNNLIVNALKNIPGPTIVLVDRTQHAEDISRLLSESGMPHTLAHGKLKASDRKAAMEDMKTSKITVGTTSLLGEGLDFPAWSYLILASPVSSEIKLLQAVGRITRGGVPGKQQAIVYDYKDDNGFAGASFKKRFEIYKKNRIWVKFPQEKANEISDTENNKVAQR